jgi:hypothetical protein
LFTFQLDLLELLCFAVICLAIMPGKLKVRIVAARDLPVMDRASELTDAFVEVWGKSSSVHH